jgi:streptogrisin C
MGNLRVRPLLAALSIALAGGAFGPVSASDAVERPGAGGYLPVPAAAGSHERWVFESDVAPAALDIGVAAARDLEMAAGGDPSLLRALKTSHAGLQAFDELVSRLEIVQPDTILGSIIDGDGGFAIEIGAQPSQKFLALVELAGLPVEINKRTDMAQSTSDKILSGLLARIVSLPETVTAEVDYAEDEGVFRLDVALTIDASEDFAVSKINESAQQMLDEMGLHEFPAPLALDLSRSQDQGALDGKRGGRLMRLISNDEGECTAGFISKRNDNVGLITAKHCANGLKYQHSDILTFVTGASDAGDAEVDLQFHRFDSGTDVDRMFRTSFDSDRDVEGVANAPLNSTVCKWGNYSEADCSIVVGTDLCRTIGGRSFCGLDSVNIEITTAGDSGGPWYYGKTARGTTTGRYNGQSYFTRIGRVENNMNAKVLIKQ